MSNPTPHSSSRSHEFHQAGTHRRNASPPRRLAIHFAVACLLTYGLEFWLHHAVDASGESHNFLTQSIFGLETFYHQLVTASPRKPAPRFTALITLSEESSPAGVSSLNVCAERNFLGEALKTLSHAKVRVVVIDKTFGDATCSKDDPGTLNLMRGVQALCAAHITLVVGRRLNERSRSQTPRGAAYPLDPSLTFAREAACVTEGVINIHLDLRRVVLWWPNVQPVAGSHSAPPTLALAASLAASPSFMRNGRLAGWTPDAPVPYVSFVRPGQFDDYNIAARDLVCSAPGNPGWRACEDGELSQKVRSLADGRVVIIGEVTPDDSFETVVGAMPGYILQANYIESLLDDRLIRPVPGGLNVLAGLLFFAAFEYIAWRHHERRLYAFILIGLLVAGSGLVIYLSVTLLGYYLNPATIGLLAVLLRLADTALVPAHAAPARERHA